MKPNQPPRKHKKVLRRSSLQTFEKQPSPSSSNETKTTAHKTVFQLAKENQRSRWSRWCTKENLTVITNHWLFNGVDGFLSFWVLLIPPFKDLFIGVDLDPFLLGCTIAIFLFFIFEIIVLAVSQKKYFMRTYFWLDVIATASLVVDMIPASNLSYQRQLDATHDSNAMSFDRYALVLGRLGRTVRLLRLFRQLRVIKVLTQGFGDTEKNGEQQPEHGVGVAETLVEKVSDRMSRRVVVIILVSIVSITLLQFTRVDRSREESIRVLTAVGMNGTDTGAFKNAVATFITLREKNIGKGGHTNHGRLLELKINDIAYKAWETTEIQPSELRANQWEQLVLTRRGITTTASFDLRLKVATQAEFDIGTICAVTGILFFFAVLLSWDSVQLIREPFQKMMRAETLSKALLSVFTVTANSDDIHEISQTVVEASHELLRCRSVNLYFIDPVSKQMICAHSCTSKPTIQNVRKSWVPLNVRGTFGVRSASMKNLKRVSIGKGKTGGFRLPLKDIQYLCVQVALNGQSMIQNNALCNNGTDYTCQNALVTPVLDATGHVVAVVEAVDKRSGEFTEMDSASMKAFSEQMSAVISRKASGKRNY